MSASEEAVPRGGYAATGVEKSGSGLGSEFESRYVKADQNAVKAREPLYNGIVGAFNETNKNEVKRILKDVDYEITNKDLEGKNTLDVIKNVFPPILKGLKAEIETLKSSQGKGTSEKVTEIQSAFENYKKEVEPKIQSFDALKNEYETFRTTKEKEMLDFQIDQRKGKHWDGFKWASGIDPFAKDGFQSYINSNYKLGLDEKGEEIVTDKNGNQIKDPSKAGAFKNFAQILEEEGMKANEKGARIYAVAKKENQNSFGQKREVKFEQDGKQPTAGRKINTASREKVS